MKKTFFLPLFFGVFILLFTVSANAQNKTSENGSTTVKILKTTGKTAVIIVGETAKTTYKIAKFTAPILLKTTEKTSVFGFNATKFIVGKTLPVAGKLIVTYLKAKLPL